MVVWGDTPPTIHALKGPESGGFVSRLGGRGGESQLIPVARHCNSASSCPRYPRPPEWDLLCPQDAGLGCELCQSPKPLGLKREPRSRAWDRPWGACSLCLSVLTLGT